jgi:fluoroquinolone resistance protein
MKKTNFIDCSIKEVDFVETDLSMAIFKNCDLLDTTFMRTILEKTDFRTAKNYSFDPEMNRIKKAKFSHLDITGLLSKYDIDIEF